VVGVDKQLKYETSIVPALKQREYKTFIVPALINNNISVLTLLYVNFTYCMAAYTIAMAAVPYVAKTWLQKKEFVIAVILFKLSLMCMNLAILTTMMLLKMMMIGRLGLDSSKKSDAPATILLYSSHEPYICTLDSHYVIAVAHL